MGHTAAVTAETTVANCVEAEVIRLRVLEGEVNNEDAEQFDHGLYPLPWHVGHGSFGFATWGQGQQPAAPAFVN